MNPGVLVGRAAGPALAAGLAAAAYSSFLLAPALHADLPSARSFISELEAAGRPYREFFRFSDVFGGLLIVVVALGLHREARFRAALDRDRRGHAGCALIAVLGLASVVDGSTRMGCAPSLDPACGARDATVTGLLSQLFEAHTLSGLAGFLGGTGGMVLIGLTLRRGPSGRGPAWGAASIVTGAVLGLTGLADLALLVTDGPFGLAERGRALLVSVWLLGAGAYLLRATVGPATGSGRGPLDRWPTRRNRSWPPPAAASGRPSATGPGSAR